MKKPNSVFIFRIVCLLTSLWQQSSHTVERRNISPCLSVGPPEYGGSNIYRVFANSGFQAISHNWLLQWTQTMNYNRMLCHRWKNMYFSSHTVHLHLPLLFVTTIWLPLMKLFDDDDFQLRMEVYFIAKAVTFKHSLDAVVSLGRLWQSCCRHGNTEFSFRSGPSETNFILGEMCQISSRRFLFTIQKIRREN